MKLKSVVIAATLLVMLTNMAVAGLVINVSQLGNDVVAVGSGTINLTSLVKLGDTRSGAGLYGPDAFIQVGPTTGLGNNVTTYDFPANGATSFGSIISFVGASSGTGDRVGVNGRFHSVTVPLGYTSGAFLSSSSTWANTTISGLGLTPGTYTYIWGSGATADSLTVNISAVPEPSSLALISTLAIGWRLTRRRGRASKPISVNLTK